MFKTLLFWLAGEVSWLAVEVLSMSKIKVNISETMYRSFYKTLVKPEWFELGSFNTLNMKYIKFKKIAMCSFLLHGLSQT